MVFVNFKDSSASQEIHSLSHNCWKIISVLPLDRILFFFPSKMRVPWTVSRRAALWLSFAQRKSKCYCQRIYLGGETGPQTTLKTNTEHWGGRCSSTIMCPFSCKIFRTIQCFLRKRKVWHHTGQPIAKLARGVKNLKIPLTELFHFCGSTLSQKPDECCPWRESCLHVVCCMMTL